MKAEAHQHWESAKISTFAHYDPEANLMVLGLGKDRLSKLDGQAISEVANRNHGVLFMPSLHSEPWEYPPEWKYQGESGRTLLGETLTRSVNFSAGDNASHSADDRQLLLLS